MTETQVVNFYDDVDENEDEEANDTDVQQREPLAKLSWKGEQFELYEGDNLIGRDKACEVMLDHKSVSGKHAEITLTRNGTAIIRDLRSANGTFVETPIGSDQYQRLTISHNRRELLNGMKIRVGMVCCEFSLLDGIQDVIYAETQMLPGIGAALETQLLPELDQDYESSMASFHTAIAIPQGEIVNPVKMSVNSTSAVRFDEQQHVVKSHVGETMNMPIYPPEIATMVDNSTQLLDITPGSISMPSFVGQPLNPVLTVPTDTITTAITTNVNIPGVRTVRATERITVSASTRVASQSTHGSDVPTQMDLELIRHIQNEHDSKEKEEEEEENEANNVLKPKDVSSPYDSGDDEEDEERSQDIMQVEGEDDQTNFIGGGEWVSSKNEKPASRDNNDNSHRVLPTRTLIEGDTMDADTDDEQVTTPAKVDNAEINANNTLIDPPISTAVTDDHSTYISTAVNSTQASPDKSQRSTVRIESSTAVPTPDILDLRKSAVSTLASPDMNPIVTPIDINHSGNKGMIHSTDDNSHTEGDLQPEEKDWLSSTPTKKENNKRNSKRDSNSMDNSSSIDGSTSRNSHRASRASASKTAIVDDVDDVSKMKRKLSTIQEGIDESAEADNMDEDQPQSKKAKSQAKKASVEECISPTTVKPGRNTRKRNATNMNDEEGDASSAIHTHNNYSETSEGNNNNSSSNANVVTTTKGRGGRKKVGQTSTVSDAATTETPVHPKTENIQNDSELTLEDEPIYLMFTKLEESAFQRYLRRLPQITVTNDPRLATHVLTTPELKRTPKLLVALNHRVRYVVMEEWLIDSAKSQHPIPLVPNTISMNTANDVVTDNDLVKRQIKAYSSALRQCKYMVRDEEKEILWRFQLAETLARIRFIPTEERHIFQQIAFYITDGIFGHTAPSQAETKSIIESAGGVLLDDATHTLLSQEQFWQPQDTPAGEEEEVVPAKRRRKSAIDTNEFVTENKRKSKENGSGGLSQEVQLAVNLCQGRKLVVISHPSVVKKCITKDVVQRLKRHILEPAQQEIGGPGHGTGRSVAPGVYSIEVLYEAVLRQELDLQVHKLDGYDFSR